MAKKSAGRKARKAAPQRHLHHVEPWPAPAEEPTVAPPAPEGPVRAPVSLRRPGSNQSGYLLRRDRSNSGTAVATANIDYSYVARDLRRVAILVVLIVAVLIALTFVLR